MVAFKKRFLLFVTVAVVMLAVFFTAINTGATAYASTVSEDLLTFEDRNVLDDLNGSVIGGEPFDIADYPSTAGGEPELIMFAEYGYSYYPEKQDDYGLYVYIYNPQGYAFDTSSSRNKIQLSYGGSVYEKYFLIFLNCSAGDCEGRFYKFKVNFSAAKKVDVLRTLELNKRVYNVSGIELSVNNVVTEYGAGEKVQTYTYSGFAQGYGMNAEDESTLTCSVDGFKRYIELDVHHTVYRPEGNYYEGKQSQLNSCYFRVPEEYFEEYGYLSKIVAEWYEYFTKPILVTETKEFYDMLYPLHGRNVKNISSNNDFLIFAQGNTDTSWFGDRGEIQLWTSNIDLYDSYTFVSGSIENLNTSGSRFNNFAAVFYTGINQSYTDCDISAEDVEAQLLLNSNYLGGDLLTQRYSSALFENHVNPDHKRGYNRAEVNYDDIVRTWKNTTAKSFWQEVFGGYSVETKYNPMNAIVTSGDKDFDISGSTAAVSERFCIAETDVPDFKAEYDKAKTNGERLVLFRFGESEYYSIPCTEAYCSSSTEDSHKVLMSDSFGKWLNTEYTAYIAQETVYLDFDIISLWFTAEDGTETEIPVVSSPKDVISGLKPPNEENYNSDGNSWWKWLLGLLALFLIVFILFATGILPLIVKGIVWVILLPFRFVAWIVKSIKQAVNKNKKE